MYICQMMGHSFAVVSLLLTLFFFSHSSAAMEIGELAPTFELRTMDGEIFRLQDYRGKKAVYLVFWNTWCSYCIKKTPRYKNLQEKFGERIELIAVNTTWSDSLEDIKQFQQRYGVNYPIIMDDGEILTERYAVVGVPTEFIIDIDGVIRYRDAIPEYLVAHIPDWFQPYTADMHPGQMCLK